MTNAPNLTYSQFLREPSLNGLLMDMWVLIAVAITLAYSILFFKNPNKNVYPILAIRAFMDGTISLYELDNYGMKVM